MPVIKQTRPVKRYYTRGEFNPRSVKQLKSLMQAQGDITETTDKKTLEQLAKKNPFYQDILNLRAVGKVKSTYCDGIEALLDAENRVHASYIHRPSTMRLSARKPNLTNIVGDKEENKIAAGFKKVVTATSDDTFIWEADFTGIEALLVGYLIKDPRFIRLSKLGIHDWHASHVVGRPVSLEQSDELVGKALKLMKQQEPVQRNKSKITVYGSLYAQSPWGLQKTWPEVFPRVQDAAQNQEILFSIFPALKKWHQETQFLAHKQGYLGLDSHPWKYRHWFWDVFSWDAKKGEWKPGADSKRCLAYYPQSIAAGIIKEASIRVAKRIGHTFYGKTPIRALIHDSILGESEKKYKDFVLAVLKEEMTKPILELPMDPSWGFGSHLSIGISIKIGQNWQDMEEVDLGQLGTADDTAVREWEEEDE